MAIHRLKSEGLGSTGSILTLFFLVLLTGCKDVGQINGVLDGYRYGALSSAYFAEKNDEDLALLSVFLSDYEYSCAEIGRIARSEADIFTDDDHRQVGFMTLNILSLGPEPNGAGHYSILESVDLSQGHAIAFLDVVTGANYQTYASALGVGGFVDLRRNQGVEGFFELETEVAGAFHGEFQAVSCPEILSENAPESAY